MFIWNFHQGKDLVRGCGKRDFSRQWYKGLKGNNGKEGFYLLGMGRQNSKGDRGGKNNSKEHLIKSYGKHFTVDAF